MSGLTIKELEAIYHEADQRAREMASAAPVSRKKAMALLKSPHGQSLLARALAIAVIEHDKLPSSDRKDMLSMLFGCFFGLGEVALAHAIEEAAIERREAAHNSCSGG